MGNGNRNDLFLTGEAMMLRMPLLATLADGAT
jgi:hypothetical protein